MLLQAPFRSTDSSPHGFRWAGGHFLDEFDLNAVKAVLSRMRGR